MEHIDSYSCTTALESKKPISYPDLNPHNTNSTYVHRVLNITALYLLMVLIVVTIDSKKEWREQFYRTDSRPRKSKAYREWVLEGPNQVQHSEPHIHTN